MSGTGDTPDKDPDKDNVRSDWEGRAPYWDRWADAIAELADRMNQPLLEAVGITSGQRVLDLASGAGEPALTIARRVGATGSVTATDLVPAMLAGARRRATAAGLSNLAFDIADMEALPYPARSFDAVTCRFGIMFVPEPSRALSEARRVLMEGGRAGFMVWGPIEDTTAMHAVREAGLAVLGPDLRQAAAMPFRLGVPGTLTRLFTAAGFSRVEEREIRFAPEIPSDRPFWRPMLDMTFGPHLAQASDAVKGKIEQGIRERLEPYRDGAVYRLRVHVRIGLGTSD